MGISALDRIMNKTTQRVDDKIRLLEELLEYVADQKAPQVFPLKTGACIIYCPPVVSQSPEETSETAEAGVMLIGPNGETEKVTSISEFCRKKFGTSDKGKPKFQSSFSDLLTGKRQSPVQGWKAA